MKRLFIAIPLEDRVGLEIDELLFSLDVRSWSRTTKHDLHITALFLGDVFEQIIPDVKTIIGNIASRARPFALRGGRTLIMRPDEPTMLWIRYDRNQWFERLVADLESSFHRVGTWERKLDRKQRKQGGGDRFPIPHITLARIRGGGMLDTLLPPLEATALMDNFVVRKIALYETVAGPKNEGAFHYEKLGEWTLGGDDDNDDDS